MTPPSLQPAPPPDYSDTFARVADTASGSRHPLGGVRRVTAGQCSCLITKYEPRMVPASFDRCFANVTRDASSA